MKKTFVSIFLSSILLAAICFGMGDQPIPGKITRAQIGSEESIKGQVFNKLYISLKEANKYEAYLLAPENYENGKKQLLVAEDLSNKNENMAKVRAVVDTADGSFNKAVKIILNGNTLFENMLDARKDAAQQGIQNKFPQKWQEADKYYLASYHLLEKGEKEKAVLEAGKAEAIYREKEYQIINNKIIGAAQKAIAEAEASNANNLTPKTIKKAKDLLNNAKDVLKQDRYAAEKSGGFARQAELEARHAVQLIKTMNKLKEEGRTGDLEYLLLRAELPLQEIGKTYGTILYFEEGMEQPLKDILERIKADNKKN